MALQTEIVEICRVAVIYFAKEDGMKHYREVVGFVRLGGGVVFMYSDEID